MEKEEGREEKKQEEKKEAEQKEEEEQEDKKGMILAVWPERTSYVMLMRCFGLSHT